MSVIGKTYRTENSKDFALFAGALILSMITSYLIVKYGTIAGFLVLAAGIGIPLAIASFVSIQFGLIMTLFFSFAIFHLSRVISDSIPWGVVIDLFTVLPFTGLLIRYARHKNVDWNSFKHPITYGLVIWIAYSLLQIVNPNASSLPAYFNATRGVIFTTLITYIICLQGFNNLKFYFLFLKLFLGFSLLAAIYGIYQEMFGFFEFEWNYIYAKPNRYNLIYIWGRFRKWSFMSDVATFGMTMALSGVICLVLSLGPFSLTKRALLFVSGAIMLVSMSFSGTRTAYAMVPAGFALYVLMTMNNAKTWLFCIAFLGVMGIIMFGPYKNGSISRIRSTFETDEDASMHVRDRNRARIQPYIHTHPMGGGVFTTGPDGEKYCPRHPLAGFPPDNGYLRTTLEKGWIGLVITFGLFYMVFFIGLKNYFTVRNPKIKILYAANIAGMFSLMIGQYAQEALNAKPINLFVIATFAAFIKLKEFDNEKESKEQKTEDFLLT